MSPVGVSGGGNASRQDVVDVVQHFVCQRVNVSGGVPLHLAEHLGIATRAFEHIYGVRTRLDERAIEAQITHAVRVNHYPAKTAAIVQLRFLPDDGDLGRPIVEAVFERSLLDAGYAHSSLRPRGATFEYSVPYADLPTNFQLSAAALFDTLAFARFGASKSLRREGDRLISCGGSPVFAIRGRFLLTPPLADGAIDSVERRLIIARAGEPKSRLQVREEPVLCSELRGCDELFFADAAGITSFSECDGAKFMAFSAAGIL